MSGSGGLRRQPLRIRRPAAIAKAAFAAILLASAVLVITAAGVFRDSLPEFVRTIAPWDAGAKTTLAQQIVMREPNSERLAQAQSLANSAYNRDPTAIKAITTLGVAAAIRKDEPVAEAAFRQASLLTQRDVQARLLQIEERVARNDIPGALRHYDALLRTSPSLWDRLFTILTSASSQPDVARELNRVLARHPRWWRNFAYHIILTSPDPVAVASVLNGVIRDADGEDRDLASRYIDRMIALERPDLAMRGYAKFVGAKGALPLVRDPTFTDRPRFPPFDWQFAEDGSLLPEIRPRAGAQSNLSLFLPDRPATSGFTARQMLGLRPGRYQIVSRSAVSGGDNAGPVIELRCIESNRALARIPLPGTSTEGQDWQRPVAVSATCPYQWLTILVQDRSGLATEGQSWIEFLDVRPA